MSGLVQRLLPPALLMSAVVLTLGTGWMVARHPGLGVGIAVAVVTVGLATAQPALLPVLAMPLLAVGLRVGGGGVDLTLSDFALGLALWPAVLFGPRPLSPPMRRLLWLNALYQAVTLLTVVANPFLANTVEWVHAWLLVSGALLVGWAVGRSGYARQGLTLLLLVSLVIALSTIGQGLVQLSSGNTAAVYPDWPWSMHKNFAGTLLGFAAVLVYVHPAWMGWSRRWALAAFWVFGVAIAFTQSRQALLALGAVLVVLTLRGGERRRSRLILVAVVPALLFVGTLVRDQVEAGNPFNSVFQRLDWYAETWAISLEAPWLGYGLRYWTGPEPPASFQPPNVILEQLATSGVVGLLGFLVMIGGTLVVLWRMDPAFGTLALGVVLSRLLQGQFDLFWISIGVSVPFALAGVALGAEALHRSREGDTGRVAAPGVVARTGAV